MEHSFCLCGNYRLSAKWPLIDSALSVQFTVSNASANGTSICLGGQFTGFRRSESLISQIAIIEIAIIIPNTGKTNVSI